MGFFYSFTLAAGALFGIWQGGIFAWTGVALLFGVHLCADEILKDRKTPSELLNRLLFHKGAAALALNLAIPSVVIFMGVSLWKISQMTSYFEIAGSILSVGVVFGVMGLNVAHENVHSRHQWRRVIGLFVLALINYCWFKIAHIEVHHRWVGTNQDPGTARANENLWAFCWRHYTQCLMKSVALEKARVGWGWRNRWWLYSFMGVVAGVLVFTLGAQTAPEAESLQSGLRLVFLWMMISVVAKFMLSTLDYIEHKGVTRALLTDGRGEPIGPTHAWDSHYTLNNFGLFNLGYHLHHHQKSSLEFTSLTGVPGTRRLPNGYAMMFVKSYFLRW
jgi:alkane 1-monooxygenase